MTSVDVDAVKTALIDKGWNGAELAARARLRPGTVYKFMSGQGGAAPRTFKVIGDALGVRPSSLMKKEDNEPV